MPRHIFKRYSPDPKKLREHKHMRKFGRLLRDQNLWHLNRRSVSGAFAVGLFWAMIPIPFQMLASAATAISVRVNLPVSAALVWLSNPLSMPPIFYFNYLVGTWLMPHQQRLPDTKMSLEWFTHSMGEIWLPLYLGSIVVGTIMAALGYGVMRLYWRWYAITQYRKRQQTRNKPSSS